MLTIYPKAKRITSIRRTGLSKVAEELDKEINMKKVSKEKLGPTAKTPAEEKIRFKQPW